jgi:hypothetical protein
MTKTSEMIGHSYEVEPIGFTGQSIRFSARCALMATRDWYLLLVWLAKPYNQPFY